MTKRRCPRPGGERNPPIIPLTHDEWLAKIMSKKERKLCTFCAEGKDSNCVFHDCEEDLVNEGACAEDAFVEGLEDEQGAKAARHACCSWHIKEAHGILGERKRRALPACVEAHIKRAFPAPSDKYKYYEESPILSPIPDFVNDNKKPRTDNGNNHSNCDNKNEAEWTSASV